MSTPLGIRAMGEVGIDLSGHRSKTLDRFLDAPWDYVITGCDSANERCPVFPRSTRRRHWSFEDPSRATGSDAERLPVFRKIRDEIAACVHSWLSESPRWNARAYFARSTEHGASRTMLWAVLPMMRPKMPLCP